MSLPYNVLDGYKIDEHFPELREFAAGPLLKITQETFGVSLELMTDPKRAFRIQCYRAKHEGFKWHLDGGLYSALLTLVNTNEGATEVLSLSGVVCCSRCRIYSFRLRGCWNSPSRRRLSVLLVTCW